MTCASEHSTTATVFTLLQTAVSICWAVNIECFMAQLKCLEIQFDSAAFQ